MSGQNSLPYPGPLHPSGKLIVSSTVHTEMTNVSDNGMTESVVTRTVTDFYSDGTQSTRRETHTTREEEIVGGMGHPSGHSSGQQPQQQQRPPPIIEHVSPPAQPPPQQQRPPPTIEHVSPPAQPPPQLPSSSQKYGTTSWGGTTSHNYSSSGTTNTTQKMALITMNDPPEQSRAINPMTPSKSQLMASHNPSEDIFIEEALKCHNRYRALHHAGPLIVSKELCQSAKNWAEQLVHRGMMENSHFGYGENIYWISSQGQGMKGDVPVEYWYNEEAGFDWNKMDFQKNTGSFTQVVWKASTQFGIGKSSGPKGTYVVAFYIPPGNILGKFRENVFRKSYHE